MGKTAHSRDRPRVNRQQLATNEYLPYVTRAGWIFKAEPLYLAGLSMNVPPTTWSDDNTAKAHSIWGDYQRHNNMSGKRGLTAGVDPVSGGVWFGETAKDIILQ